MSEEIKPQNKAELFAQEPNNFYHINDLSIAVTKEVEGEGRQVLVNTGSMMEMGGLLFMLQRHCYRMLDMIAIKKEQDKQLVTDLNKRSFTNFLKKGR